MTVQRIDLTLAQTTADRLHHWLLRGPAQQTDGTERGGVAGSVTGAGRAEYVYGEITGYYLTWLASPQREPTDATRAAAAAAAAWAGRRYSTLPLTPTRIHLGEPSTDWRNQVQFCFDLAMLVGGLAAATSAQLIECPTATLAFLLEALDRFAGEQGLLPCEHATGFVPPDRWSTRPGPFLVKAAQRIRLAAAHVPLPATLERACALHIARQRPAAESAFADPVHPTMYHLEGWLGVGAGNLPVCATLWRRIVATVDAAGNLAESVDTPGVHRSDIVAQVLRIGLLLASHGLLTSADEACLGRLAGNLCARVAEDGSLAFREDAEPRLANVWCAMFAEQALGMWVDHRSGLRLLVGAADLV